MTLKQICVSIENSPRRLYEVTRSLQESGVRVRALSVADTGKLGQIRVLVSDIGAARQVLMKKDLPAWEDEVVAAEIDDQSAEYPQLLKDLCEAHAGIEYVYASSRHRPGKTIMIFRFRDIPTAVAVMRKRGIRVLDAEEIATLSAAA